MPSPLLKARPALVDFGKQLRRLREDANLTQVELAQRSAMGERFIVELELGRGNPSLATMVLLADGLDCQVADFFSIRVDE